MSVPHSLPSFAQAFSTSSLSDAHISNALPPIQHRADPNTSKKRQRQDTSPDAYVSPPFPATPSHPTPRTSHPDPTRQSPLAVRIKEEDRDDPHHTPHSLPISRDSSATPGVRPSSKKRRVTVSGAPHGPNTAEQGTPIPISPLLATFPLPDDAAAPRPTLAKQQQKTLDQRRECISAAISSRSPPGDQLTASKLARIGRVSPSVVNRCAGNAIASGSQATPSSARPLTPPPMAVQQPQPAQTATDPTSKPQQPAAAHSLPPPPISFARRRAAQPGGRKKKPADILISPRSAGPSDPLAPVIQSAPPVADPGRFPMAIPRLPLMLNNAPTVRRVAGNVPPTPTRFSLQATSAPSISSTARTIQSPPSLSVPIASTLVPPTPHALHHPGYTGDKSAFLAPFEVFYDALNDSKQLKTWLSDQLQRSNTLMMSLRQQQEKMDEIVEDLVEKRTRVMREEITMLRRRMESLEEAVRAGAPPSAQDPTGHGYPQGAKSYQNVAPTPAEPPLPSRFPEQRKPDTTPGREQEHQPSSSPPVEVTRRLSVSATAARPEPPQVLFALGGHSRGPSGSQGSAKGAPLVRAPGIAERSSTSRPTDSRPAPRLFYPGSYGNGNPLPVEGQASARVGDK
ncbi:hypothetical protein HD554DRAFT_2021982 [Boletus coccyginus]|nr:hypothetical protein HD554DRAFT_2021982 [Boletus coccyginus]